MLLTQQLCRTALYYICKHGSMMSGIKGLKQNHTKACCGEIPDSIKLPGIYKIV